MKNVISDSSTVKALVDRLNLWIEEHDGEQTLISDIIELAEYPLFRLSLKVEFEKRRIIPFSKPGNLLPAGQARAFAPENLNIWAVECKRAYGFDDCRELIDLPSSLNTVACKLCGGSGKLSCPDCRGQKAVYCSECHGDGKIHCPVCKHTKTVSCPRCSGRGRAYSEYKKTYETCPDCLGRGNVECTNCKNGYVVCSSCGSKGRLDCARCKNTGEIECRDCSGMGGIVSGQAVEVMRYPHEEKMELENADIPGNILKDISPKLLFQPALTVDNRHLEPDDLREKGLPADIQKDFYRLRSVVNETADTRIIFKKFVLEKKSLYLLSFGYGGKENKVWFGDAGQKIVCDYGLLNDINLDMINDIYSKLENDDIPGAVSVCGKISGIRRFAPQIRDIKRIIRKKLLISFFSGASLGFLLFSGFIIPILFRWRSQSFHVNFLIMAGLAVNFAAAFLAGAVVYLINPGILDRQIKRFFAGAVAVIIILSVVYVSASLMKLDPAKALDRKQMLAEYTEHFPFGLRTLSNREDIKFLENMAAKYSLTGIDTSYVRDALSWLKGKQKKDEVNITSIKQTAKEIEEKRNRDNNYKASAFNRRSKIYIK